MTLVSYIVAIWPSHIVVVVVVVVFVVVVVVVVVIVIVVIDVVVVWGCEYHLNSLTRSRTYLVDKCNQRSQRGD